MINKQASSEDGAKHHKNLLNVKLIYDYICGRLKVDKLKLINIDEANTAFKYMKNMDNLNGDFIHLQCIEIITNISLNWCW